jgi:hypothetical protein
MPSIILLITRCHIRLIRLSRNRYYPKNIQRTPSRTRKHWVPTLNGLVRLNPQKRLPVPGQKTGNKWIRKELSNHFPVFFFSLFWPDIRFSLDPVYFTEMAFDHFPRVSVQIFSTRTIFINLQDVYGLYFWLFFAPERAPEIRLFLRFYYIFVDILSIRQIDHPFIPLLFHWNFSPLWLIFPVCIKTSSF